MEETNTFDAEVKAVEQVEEINPYFAIEEDIYGAESKKRRRKTINLWILIGVLSAAVVSFSSMVIYDTCVNIHSEVTLSEGTKVNGLTYKELRASFKDSTDSSKTWVDFESPVVLNEELSNDSPSINLVNNKLVISNTASDSYNYLLVDSRSQAIYQANLAFDGNEFDFSTRTMDKGDYILCALKNPLTIPYKVVVDNHFYSKLGRSNYRRASAEDFSIQQSESVTLIQDPTLLCLTVVRIS